MLESPATPQAAALHPCRRCQRQHAAKLHGIYEGCEGIDAALDMR